MSDALEPSGSAELTEATLAKIEANYAEMRDFAASLPDNLPVAKHLLHFYAVHIDEEGRMEPEQDKVNTQFIGAITALESRIARIETALDAANISRPK